MKKKNLEKLRDINGKKQFKYKGVGKKKRSFKSHLDKPKKSLDSTFKMKKFQGKTIKIKRKNSNKITSCKFINTT